MLYCGTYNFDPSSETGSQGAELWAYNGTSWNEIASGGFGDARNQGISSLCIYSGRLYIGTEKYQIIFDDTNYPLVIEQMMSKGCDLFVYDKNGLGRIAGDGFGNVDNEAVNSMAVHKGNLYVGTGSINYSDVYNDDTGETSDVRAWSDGFELYRYGPSGFQNVLKGGYGNVWDAAIMSMQVQSGDDGGVLLLGTYSLSPTLEAGAGPCKLLAYDGDRFYKGADDGWGNAENEVLGTMAEHEGNIYCFAWNYSGAEVWYGKAPASAPEAVSTWYLAEGSTNGGSRPGYLFRTPITRWQTYSFST